MEDKQDQWIVLSVDYLEDTQDMWVHDKIIYIALYDEELQVLGYAVLSAVFNEGYVMEGYEVTNYWNPVE